MVEHEIAPNGDGFSVRIYDPRPAAGEFARLRRWVKRVVVSFALLGILLAGVGVVYQSISTARDLRRFPPPGKLIDVGGYRLHIHCVGEDSPTVVLDSGFDDTSLVWRAIQPEVAKFTRICAYDRAGVGWIDAGPAPTHSRQMVEELHTLLKNAGVSDAYVLVGSLIGFRFPSHLKGSFSKKS